MIHECVLLDNTLLLQGVEGYTAMARRRQTFCERNEASLGLSGNRMVEWTAQPAYARIGRPLHEEAPVAIRPPAAW